MTPSINTILLQELKDDRIKFMAQRDALATAANRLLQLHDDAVFVCGSDDEILVAETLSRLRSALKNALR